MRQLADLSFSYVLTKPRSESSSMSSTVELQRSDEQSASPAVGFYAIYASVRLQWAFGTVTLGRLASSVDLARDISLCSLTNGITVAEAALTLIEGEEPPAIGQRKRGRKWGHSPVLAGCMPEVIILRINMRADIHTGTLYLPYCSNGRVRH